MIAGAGSPGACTPSCPETQSSLSDTLSIAAERVAAGAGLRIGLVIDHIGMAAQARRPIALRRRRVGAPVTGSARLMARERVQPRRFRRRRVTLHARRRRLRPRRTMSPVAIIACAVAHSLRRGGLRGVAARARRARKPPSAVRIMARGAIGVAFGRAALLSGVAFAAHGGRCRRPVNIALMTARAGCVLSAGRGRRLRDLGSVAIRAPNTHLVALPVGRMAAPALETPVRHRLNPGR